MPDVSILLPDAAAPTGYTVPSTSEIIPKSASAIIDGSSATTAFYPVLEIVSDGGNVVAQSRGSAVAAGGSVEQSWFPGALERFTQQVAVGNTLSGGVVLAGGNAHVSWETVNIQGGDISFAAGTPTEVPVTAGVYASLVYVTASSDWPQGPDGYVTLTCGITSAGSNYYGIGAEPLITHPSVDLWSVASSVSPMFAFTVSGGSSSTSSDGYFQATLVNDTATDFYYSEAEFALWRLGDFTSFF